MNKHLQRCLGLATALGVALIAADAVAATPPAPRALARCEALVGRQIASDLIGLPTKGARIVTAERIAAAPARFDEAGDRVLDIAAHCRVQGQVASVSPDAPPINFNINLPLSWNGKALQSGGGGMGGAVVTAPGMKASGAIDPDPLYQPYRLNQGWVTFGSDEGHTRGDYSFFKSDEAMRNWGGDYVKKTKDVALQVIELAYGQSPRRLYFTGESAGGREVVRASQRFGDEYDGFIATSPVLSWTFSQISDNALRTLLIDGWLDAAAIKLIANQTREHCDTADGLKDGVIARYLECRPPVAALRCKVGGQAEPCLSDRQVAALNHLREGWKAPPEVTVVNGERGFPGFGVTGDEDGPLYQYDSYPVGKIPPSRILPAGLGSEQGRGSLLNFGAIWVRNAIVQDAAFNPTGFDPTPYAQRIRYLSSLFDATEPNLSKLKTRGSKLIILQPSADVAVATAMVAGYYRSVQATMGADAAALVRLYVGPGGGHNVVGVSQTDLLKLMEDWVDNGRVPPTQVAVEDVDPKTLKVRRAMVACQYPAYARYKGAGDPNASASFTCTSRPDPLGASR